MLLFEDCDNALNDQTDPFEPLALKNRRRPGGVGQPLEKEKRSKRMKYIQKRLNKYKNKKN